MIYTRIERARSRQVFVAAPRALSALIAAALLVALCFATAQPAQAGPCEVSARLAFKACNFDVKDDLYVARAICAHRSNAGDRGKCLADAQAERDDANRQCQDVFDFRKSFCADSGERYYDPPFDKSVFTTSFDNSNPFWPLAVGSRWEFEGPDERVVVEVLPATKRIDGVDCIVVNDVVADKSGELIEDTDDWYVMGRNGDVWYCGEQVKDYQYVKGDNPREAELIAIDGSFKQGVAGAKAGIAMKLAPTVGEFYRQEFALGDAEDGAEVMSTTYRYGDGSGLDKRVPRALADLFCNGDCLVTREFNLKEPGAEALKYYSPGVGVFLEVEGRSVTRLVSCNVDPRCDQL